MIVQREEAKGYPLKRLYLIIKHHLPNEMKVGHALHTDPYNAASVDSSRALLTSSRSACKAAAEATCGAA